MSRRVKRISLSFVLLFVLTIMALALTPHYSCACASKEITAKRDGSWLTYIIGEFTK